MTIHVRSFQDDSDYWRIRSFLQQTEHSENWHVCDVDYWRWHWMENVVERPLNELLLWEDEAKQLVATLIQGDPGVFHVQIDPVVCSSFLLNEMIEQGERHYLASHRDGKEFFFVWANEEANLLQQVLKNRGYVISESAHAAETTGRQRLDIALPEVVVPDGFTLRSMNDTTDLPMRSLCSWRAFHPEESDEGADPLGSWYRNIQRSPTYRHDLDVVAVDKDGTIASFATCYFDTVSRAGIIVLVGTAPLHQQKGLGKATVGEALHRLKDLGGLTASVSWYDTVAGSLHQSAGFINQTIANVWKKQLD